MSTITVKANDKVQTIAEHKVVTKDGTPTIIKAVDNTNYELLDESTGRAPNHIITKRIDKNLHVSFENDSESPDLIIEGFYDDTDSALIGMAEDGSYYYYIPDSGEVADYVTELEIGDIQGQALGGNAQPTPWWIGATETDGFDALPWLAGLAGVGLLGAALGSSSSSNSDNNKPPVDITAPDAPTDLEVSADGSTVTGTGEPGSNVEITDPNGDVIGEGKVDDNGNFEVSVNPPQVDGEEIEVTLTDKAGNTSDPSNATAPDITAPDAPTSITVGNDDGFLNEAEIDADGNVDVIIGLPDNAVAGDTVIVNGQEQTLTSDDINNKEVTVKVPAPAEGESLDITATIKDAAGNESSELTENVGVVDTTAPGEQDGATQIAPVIAIPEAEDGVNADEIADGIQTQVTLPTGTLEGDSITLTVTPVTPAGGTPIEITHIVTGPEVANGVSEVTIPNDLNGITADGDYSIVATVTDQAGNSSAPSTALDFSVDTEAPSAPTIDSVNEDGVAGSVTAGEGAETVEITLTPRDEATLPVGATDNGDGSFTITVPVEADGSFSSGVTPKDGTDVSAEAVDAAGNHSTPTVEVGVDTTAPDNSSTTIVIDDLTADNVINKAESKEDVAVSGTVEGDFTAGDIVTVTVNDQSYESTVATDGTFSTSISGSDLANDSQVVVTVTATDAAGNVGQVSKTQTYEVDLIAPSAPEGVAIGNGNDYITADEIDADGNVDVVVALPVDAEVEDTLIVTGNGISEEYVLTENDISNGEVIIKLPAPAEDGTLDVTAYLTDPAGNQSVSTDGSAKRDTVAPDEDSTTINIDPITDDNVINKAESKEDVAVTGKVEGDFTAGDTATITVNGQSYESTVATDGSFNIAVSGSDLANDNQVIVTVTATDAAGNVGQVSKTQPYEIDLVAPSAPTSIFVGNDDGFLNAEEVDADNNVIVVIGLPDDAKAGDTIIVNGQEQALTPDDITNKEVTVKVPAPAEGESLDITATIKDAAGNESQPLNKNVGVVDTIAPDAPTNDFTITDNVANDGSGDVLEPPEIIPAGGVTNDNTPSINIPTVTLGVDETAQLVIDGEVVEATIVDNADGSVTLTPNNALKDGAHDLSYNLKDAAGNTSANGPVVNIIVDTTAPGEQDGATQVAPVIAIPEAENGINADEIADGIQTQITLPTGTLEGDSVILTVTPAGGSTPIQITHVVTDTEATAGLSEITIPNNLNGITADGDYSIVATVTDQAGNSSAPSDSFEFTVDTVAELTVDTPIAGDGVVNADEAAEGFNVTGTGTAGDTIALTNQAGDLIGTAIVGLDNRWSIVVSSQNVTEMGDGSETLTITATDPAGNESFETADITIVPATALTITSPIAGDNLVNADEAGTGFDVTGTGAAGDTITLTNQAGELIGTVVVGPDNRWSIAVDSAQVAAMGEGDETLTATSTFNADVTRAKIIIDTAAPNDTTTEITVDNVTADNVINAIEAEGDIAVTGSVTGDYSEGDALTITVNGIVHTGAVDASGRFSIDVSGADLVADADNTIDVSITATDKAGNTGIVTTTKDYTVNTDEIIAAADNFVDLQLKADPLEIVNESPSDLNKTGFTVVGASLGPVLGAGVVADIVNNSVILEVGEDQVREVKVQGNAGGVQIAGTMDLSLYKLNESTNEWELQEVKENWVVSYLLGGVSKETDFSLDEGQWLFVMSGGEGISALTGYTLKFLEDTVLDYSEATAVSGSVTGNILADDDASFSYDELPNDTTVTSITSFTGTQTFESGETTIQGQYGTLTISPDGTYEYSVNEDFRGPYGSEEHFTYTVASPDGNTASAELTIQLNILPVDKQIKIDKSLVVDAEPTVILDTENSEIKDAVGFGVLDLSFGSSSVLDLELLGGKPPLEFTVGDNQVRELTLHGSAGGVELAKTYSMAVYKLDEDTGQYVQVHFEKNWFNAPLLGGKSDPLTLQFGEGDYKAVLLTAGGVGLLSGNGLYVDHDTVYDYDQPSKFMGEITGDATPDEGTVILKVGEDAVTSNGPMTYQGKYGQLTIDANGEYTYSVNNNASDPNWQPPYGEVDSFRLVTKDANGNAAVETLNIKISTHTAVDDFNNTMVSERNLETSDKVIDGVSAATKNISRDFTVAEDTLTSATLKIDTTTIGTRLEYSIIDKDTGEVVSTNKGNVSRSLDVTIDNLAPGNYTIEIKRVAGLGHLRINGSEFTTHSFHLDEYSASDIAPVEGLLLENDAGIGNISELKVDSKSVFISDPNQGAKSIDIEGLYGTLTVYKDGSYSYLPNGESFGIEHFTYETTSITGVKETATLEINVGKNITASIYNDTAISSAANDSFTMGAGADTLVFDNLGGAAGGNGNNGLDTWTDFDAGQGDKIDISGLLDGNQTASNINNYLAYENGVLMVDRNGNSEFEALLEVTATDLDTLLGSIEWQAGAAGISAFSIGEMGEDTISLGDSSFDSPLGGLNEELNTFNLMGADQTIGLSDVLETEVIDISGMGADTLSVQRDDVASAAVSNPIYVKDDNDGSADLSGNDWANSGQNVADNTGQIYDVWQVENTLSSQNYIDTEISPII